MRLIAAAALILLSVTPLLAKTLIEYRRFQRKRRHLRRWLEKERDR